jgi:hypothetical protein
VQYDRVMYLLEDTLDNHRLIHEQVEVVEYPKGIVEVQADGQVIVFATYDRIAQVQRGAEVENKRLTQALSVSRLMQAKRDDRRACDAPSQMHRGEQVQAKKLLEGLKKQRALSIADVNEAILEVSAKAMRERRGGCAAPTLQPEGKHPLQKFRHFNLASTSNLIRVTYVEQRPVDDLLKIKTSRICPALPSSRFKVNGLPIDMIVISFDTGALHLWEAAE